MEELNFGGGGRPIYSEDIDYLQKNALAIQDILNTKLGDKNCILSGFDIIIENGPMGRYAVAVSSGFIYLDGKLRFYKGDITALVTSLSDLKFYVVPSQYDSEELVKYKDGRVDHLYSNYYVECYITSDAPETDNYMLLTKDPDDIEHQRMTYEEYANIDERNRIELLESFQFQATELNNIFDFAGLNTDERIAKIRQWPVTKSIAIMNGDARCGFSKIFFNADKTLVTQIACTNFDLAQSNASELENYIFVRHFNLKTYSVILKNGVSVPGLSWSDWTNYLSNVESDIKTLAETKASQKALSELVAIVSEKADKTFVEQVQATLNKLATSDEVKSLSDAMAAKANMVDVDAKLATKQDNLLGEIKMWAGSGVPQNYMLCDGRELKISDYNELYEAIGSTFNRAMDHNGSYYATTSGYFRLPDLQGRFIVGKSSSDSNYNNIGNAGGEKAVVLDNQQMPKHSHKFAGDDQLRSHVTEWGGTYVGVCHANGASNSGDSYIYSTSEEGGNLAHENRPPFYTLAYIIRVK